jgi:hypothetical protein
MPQTSKRSTRWPNTSPKPRERTLSGKWRLAIYIQALSEQLKIAWPAQWYLVENPGDCVCKVPNPAQYDEARRRWKVLGEKLEGWLSKYPHSAHARIALAQLAINEAWFYRSSGSASIVPDKAWPLFFRYVEEARQTLTAQDSTSALDPVWFSLMFTISAAQSWSPDRVDGLTQNLLKHGRSYSQAYQDAAMFLLPKWGGSYERIDELARQAMARADQDEGAELYARIYWQGQFDARIFQDTRADWPTMKRGFDQMLKKYPDPRNLNGRAMFACAAGDADTFRETMVELGDRVAPDTWITPERDCLTRYPVVMQ